MNSGIDIPRNIKQVTPLWLTEALRSSGVLDSLSEVTVISEVPLKTSAGQSGWYADLIVEYSPRTQSAPRRMFLKGMKSNSDLFSNALANFFRHELIFYSKVAPLTQVRVPEFYFGEVAHDSSAAILALEALDSSTIGSMVDGLSVTDLRLLLQQLAGLHGRWWNSSEMDSFNWPKDQFRLAAENHYAPKLRNVLERIKTESPELLSPSATELAETLVDRIPEVWSYHQSTPRSLLQNDAGVNNVAFEKVNGSKRAIMFDWLCAPGPVAWDVGLAICVSLIDSDVPHIPQLSRDYASMIRESGVTLSDDEALHIVRVGSLSAFAARLFALSPTFEADPSDPLTAMRLAGFRRVSQAIEVLDSIDVLREIVTS